MLIFLFFLVLKVQALLELNDSNFDQTLKNNKYVLINYYASWSQSSIDFNQQFKKASETESEVVFAQIEASKNPDLVLSQKINSYPSIKFYINGQISDYDGDRNSQGIIDWINTKIKPINIEIKEIIQFKDISPDQASFILICNEQNKQYLDIFNQLASNYSDFSNFYYIHNREIVDQIGYKEYETLLFVIHNINDEKQEYKGEFNIENLNQFILDQTIKWKANWSQQISNVMFQYEIPILFHFDGKNNETNLLSQQNLSKIESKPHFIICFVSYDDFSAELRQYLQIEDQDFPQIRILDFHIDNDISQYEFQYDNQFTFENYSDFVQLYKNKRLKRMLKSQFDLEQDGFVGSITSNTFKKLVLQNNNTQIVFFYDKSCYDLIEIYGKLAEALQANTKLQFGQIDMSENELIDFQYEKYPSFYLYRNQEKIKMEEQFSLKNIIEFLKNNLNNDWIDININDIQHLIDQNHNQQDIQNEQEEEEEDEHYNGQLEALQSIQKKEEIQQQKKEEIQQTEL